MNRPARLLTVLAATAAIAAPVSILLAPDAAAATTLFAYANGGAVAPASCPQTATVSQQCTLAQALSLAVSGDTIALATPSSSQDYVGNWSTSVNLTIQPASGVTNPTLNGDGDGSLTCGTVSCAGSILTVGAGNAVKLDGLVLGNGKTSTSGGAIASAGTLTVTNSTFVGNSAALGGAIANSGTLNVRDSTFTSNTATTGGGAIVNASNASVPSATIATSTFNTNTSADDGGAILNGNAVNGVLTVSTSTFSGNAANGTGQGGGIYNAEASGKTDNITVTASTFANDTAGGGGPAIAVGFSSSAGTVTITGNLFAEGCLKGGTWTDNGYNAGINGACLGGGTGDVTNANVSNLGGLANNGGPTQTRMPAEPNAAIGMIPDPTAGLCPRTDQRGFTSSFDCTAGAVEPFGIGPGGGGSGPFPPTSTPSATPTVTPTVTTSPTESPTSTPTSTPTGSAQGPTITAHVTSTIRRHHGWYRAPVRITFTCAAGDAPLTGPCPGPVVLRHDGRNQVVTRTITDTNGRSATVTRHINIDQTPPSVSVDGVTDGHVYKFKNKPTLNCVATDGLSGVASCTIVQHHHHIKGTDDIVYHYVATATDNAGNKSKIRGSYSLS